MLFDDKIGEVRANFAEKVRVRMERNELRWVYIGFASRAGNV